MPSDDNLPTDEESLRVYSAGQLRQHIKDAVIFTKEPPKKIPTFQQNELRFGPILGKGGYCTVSALDGVTLSSSKPKRKSIPATENDFFTVTQDREFISDNFIRHGKHRYALKKLSPGLFERSEPQHFVNGVLDLAMEVKFLSVLRHPNIIKMRATMEEENCCVKDYFVVLDRLDLTLDSKINIWRRDMPRGLWAKAIRERENLFFKRLIVGIDICSAFVYLHDNRIVYRDLKPANLGFDVRGDVKLFDFGLATELSEWKRHQDTDTFLLTKDTGSLRYMAPEVFLGKPYNEKCDVYSFGLILWQCLDLNEPFPNYNFSKMISKVYKGLDAPNVNTKIHWPLGVRHVLRNCWLRDFSKRQSCRMIYNKLKGQIAEFHDDLLGELDDSNRSVSSTINRRTSTP